jgi:hypothetical protein
MIFAFTVVCHRVGMVLKYCPWPLSIFYGYLPVPLPSNFTGHLSSHADLDLDFHFNADPDHYPLLFLAFAILTEKKHW